MNAEDFIKNELSLFLKKHEIELPVILQRPKDENHGDFASNLAMQLARHLKKNPRQIAEEIISTISLNDSYISKAEIAGPGFINFYAATGNILDQFLQIPKLQSEFGRIKQSNPIKAQVEFVSANPTGPLTIGHGRQAVLGDTVANILEAAGYDVTREYYFNDAGRQMRVLGESVKIRYQQLCGLEIELSDDHYQGEYIIDIAKDLHQHHGDALKNDNDLEKFTKAAEDTIFENIKGTIKKLGFKFDVFFNEKSLYEQGKIDQVIKDLKTKNLVYENEGATWFKTTDLGFDQDRVIIKSSGEPTYRLPDMAYHVEKFKRKFELIVDIFGADHIDTYPDVLAALKVLGYDEEKVKVLIHQFVTLTNKGEQVKMSTRKANFVTLDELIEDVGVDVTRYFFLMRGMNTHLNFDLSLAKTQSDENPVFYIQYAHARICSIIALAESKNINTKNHKRDILENLVKKEETNLIKELLQFPEIVKICSQVLEPQRMVNYLFGLAATFHRFYTECRVITEDENLSMARLALIDGTRIVIANALHILGISAPNKM
ncbi:MAG: arginine--tRNA ligase [Calditrichaeota bacterium]|nr:MAG: arginine--tRNA ligase [Calditrichota bacterium]MBL1204715.1 arginine--tRNA ligase [Calditrichota bacterium]NOG44543.1 arginine--tRNA ligase [Calditrichota bacterium]